VNLKQVIQYLIVFIVGGFFLYFVFSGIAWSDLQQKLLAANYYWITLGMLVGVLSHYIRAWRATMLYHPMGYPIAVKNSFYAVMIGYMVNYIIPRAGEVSRCAVLNKTDGMPVQKTLGTVITERIVDLVILALLLVFVFLINFELLFNYIQSNLSNSNSTNAASNIKWFLLLMGILSIAFIYFFKNKLTRFPIFHKILQFVKGLGEGLMSIKNVRNPFLFIALSLSIWLCYILMMYFCLFAMESTASLTWMNTLVVFAIGTIGVVIPAPAAGAGTYHFAVMQSLLLFGVSEGDGIAYATIVHGVQMVLLILIGAICSIPVFLFSNKNKKT
jgi:uncharacterized protein (TIRG00374 family)